MKQLHLVPPLAVRRPAAAIGCRSRQGRRLRRAPPSPRVVPTRVPQRAEVLWIDSEQSPEDSWYAIEDLWLRLAQQFAIHAELDGTRWQVTAVGALALADGEAQALLCATLDPATYGWRVGTLQGSFALSIACDGDDLLVTMPSLSSIARWPGGEDLGWQLASFLSRLRSRSIGGAGRESSAGDHGEDVRRRRASWASTSPTRSPPAISSAPAIRSSSASDG